MIIVDGLQWNKLKKNHCTKIALMIRIVLPSAPVSAYWMDYLLHVLFHLLWSQTNYNKQSQDFNPRKLEQSCYFHVQPRRQTFGSVANPLWGWSGGLLRGCVVLKLRQRIQLPQPVPWCVLNVNQWTEEVAPSSDTSCKTQWAARLCVTFKSSSEWMRTLCLMVSLK